MKFGGHHFLKMGSIRSSLNQPLVCGTPTRSFINVWTALSRNYRMDFDLVYSVNTGVTITCPDNINTTTDLASEFANVTWNEPKVIGGDDMVEANITEQLWQLVPIGDTSITYDVNDVNDREGALVTTCSFLIHVEGW